MNIHLKSRVCRITLDRWRGQIDVDDVVSCGGGEGRERERERNVTCAPINSNQLGFECNCGDVWRSYKESNRTIAQI